MQRRRERALLLLVVTDDILKPQQLKRFTVFLQLRGETSAHGLDSSFRRCRVKRHPRTRLRKIDFNPRMCVALADSVSPCGFVVLAGQEAIYHARRNAVGAQQHDHRRGKVFAMTCPYVEKKVSKRIWSTGLHLKCV